MTKDLKVVRLIDANLNRLKEGIRVIEDIARYHDDNKELASKLKSIRHKCKIDMYIELLKSRNSENDVLRPTTKSELNRSSLNDILIANYKRTQESSRVLEEVFKIINPLLSEQFKEIRYQMYTIEKENLANL
jgi:thiamine-phosphate pyrophosphorylase